MRIGYSEVYTPERRAARTMWRKVRDNMQAEKRRKKDAAKLAEASCQGPGIGKRAESIAGGYNEARPYQRRDDTRVGGDAGEVRRRVVWRKSGGAEVGLVMQRRIEGRIPMLGRVPWEAPKRDGQTDGEDGIT